MKFSPFTLFALSSLLATAVSNPVVDVRQEADGIADLTTLLTTVQTYTGASNATLATISSSSSAADKAAALAAVGTQLTGLTGAVQASTASIKALAPVSSKRSVSSPISTRQLPTVTAALVVLLNEIFATVDVLLLGLGIDGLLIFLNPLTGALGGLILAVEVLVDSLLLAVTVLLDTLLTGLSLTLGGL